MRNGPHAKLEQLLNARRDELLEGIREAEAEIAKLTARKAELEELVMRARVSLGEAPQPARGTTLHDAMVLVLSDHPEGMTAGDLADKINARSLYRRRDGSPVPSGQIHARAGNYDSLFERRNGRIHLSQTAAVGGEL